MVFNIEVDTEKMSLEQKKKARNEMQNALDKLNHEIHTAEIAKNKFLK